MGHTFGHEFVGVVHEVGPSVENLKGGDRVMVPFNIFCGSCFFCARGLYSNPEWMDEEDAVLLTDACPTGYFAAQLGDISEGDVVAVFGAGPIGLFAAKSAWLMGAGRVIVIDHIDYRLEFARQFAHAETVNFTQVNDIVQ